MAIVFTRDQYAVFEERVLSHYRRDRGTPRPAVHARSARKHTSIGEKVHPLTRDSRKDL